MVLSRPLHHHDTPDAENVLAAKSDRLVSDTEADRAEIIAELGNDVQNALRYLEANCLSHCLGYR